MAGAADFRQHSIGPNDIPPASGDMQNLLFFEADGMAWAHFGFSLGFTDNGTG